MDEAPAGVRALRNPMPAVGGTAAESMEEVRQYAPWAFRRQERAVTEADYADVAERHREVQKAAARFRWTGSWYTVYVTVDRKGGRPVLEDPRFVRAIREHIERYRLAGYDLEIRGPLFVPLDIEMQICVEAGYFRSTVRDRLERVFSARDLPDGTRGFFHPDRFTFGQPVYLSQIYKAAADVEGVASVEIRKFKRLNREAAGEIAQGFLQPGDIEIIQLDNDPSFPEKGAFRLDMRGGL
jgi:predicted phage baseplate assembly protein